MSLAWVHRDWNNSPDMDNKPQAAQYNINSKTHFSRKYEGNCVRVQQCRVQWALLFHTPRAIHLLKLLGPLCCHPYLCGMKCNSCWEEMDGLLPQLSRKLSQGAVLLHLSGREGYGLELQEQIYTFISKLCQSAVRVFVALNRKFYHTLRQEKKVQKAKESAWQNCCIYCWSGELRNTEKQLFRNVPELTKILLKTVCKDCTKPHG